MPLTDGRCEVVAGNAFSYDVCVHSGAQDASTPSDQSESTSIPRCHSFLSTPFLHCLCARRVRNGSSYRPQDLGVLNTVVLFLSPHASVRKVLTLQNLPLPTRQPTWGNDWCFRSQIAELQSGPKRVTRVILHSERSMFCTSGMFTFVVADLKSSVLSVAQFMSSRLRDVCQLLVVTQSFGAEKWLFSFAGQMAKWSGAVFFLGFLIALPSAAWCALDTSTSGGVSVSRTKYFFQLFLTQTTALLRFLMI